MEKSIETSNSWSPNEEVLSRNTVIKPSVIYTASYIAILLFNWIAPYVLNSANRISYLLFTVYYLFVLSQLLNRITWVVYCCSLLLALLSSFFLGSQNSITRHSSRKQESVRNSFVFWVKTQLSVLIGNLYICSTANGKFVDKNTYMSFVMICIIKCLVGPLTVYLTKPQQSAAKNTSGFTKFWSYTTNFFMKDLTFLAVTFIYTDLEMIFYERLNNNLNDFRKHFSAVNITFLSGTAFFLVCGHIIGGYFFNEDLGNDSDKTLRQKYITGIGFLCHVISCILIQRNIIYIPEIDLNEYPAFLHSGKSAIIYFCTCLMGFGDSCFNHLFYRLTFDSFRRTGFEFLTFFKFTQMFTVAALSFFISQF